MKFTKFGKALLMSALSAGVILSVTSCVQSYTVGYLYVTGTVTSQSSGNGIISGFKIDHNTGKLTAINGLPVSSGGANPVRAVLLTGSRFLYVLNRGVRRTRRAARSAPRRTPARTPTSPSLRSARNGILTPQETFYTQGINPFRMIADSFGQLSFTCSTTILRTQPRQTATHAATNNPYCAAALTGATTCGDITVFQVNQTTGRLQLVVNAQVTSASGAALTYFPVPANPIDFVLSGSTTSHVERDSGDRRLRSSRTSTARSNGQLTVSQNSSAADRQCERGHGHCERRRLRLRARQRADYAHAPTALRTNLSQPDSALLGRRAATLRCGDQRTDPG